MEAGAAGRAGERQQVTSPETYTGGVIKCLVAGAAGRAAAGRQLQADAPDRALFLLLYYFRAWS